MRHPGSISERFHRWTLGLPHSSVLLTLPSKNDPALRAGQFMRFSEQDAALPYHFHS